MAYIHPDRRHNHDPTWHSKDAGYDDTNGFDFGAGMPLPPTSFHVKPDPDPYGPPGFVHASGRPIRSFRSFHRDADTRLLDYLRGRNISTHFLHEIDLFLSSHEELAYYDPSFCASINQRSVLDAYKYFIKGYTKPARYREGFLPDLYAIPLPPSIVPLTRVYDTELADFFAGHDFRMDILEAIDDTTLRIAKALYHGHNVSFAERRLAVYTLFGNPVDAFKYYEYNFQREWLAHRYLPEHIALMRIPKQPGYSLPRAMQVADGGETCPAENQRSYPTTRLRMARANDQGVDVIDVLLEDFVAVLCRRGLTRKEIEIMRQEAVRQLDHQREVGDSALQMGRIRNNVETCAEQPTTEDIVDMIMHQAHRTVPANTRRVTMRRHDARKSRLEGLKRYLRDLMTQEDMLQADDASQARANITRMRQQAERQLVNAISKNGRVGKQALKRLRAAFRPSAQEKRDQAGRQIDLLQEISRIL